MEVAELDEALKVLDSSLSLIKWRLKSQSRRRLEIDILALCTGMRPVVMIDYGGKMPELQERLCALIKLIQKQSPIFEHLKVMVIEDMIYLIHVKGLSEYVRSSLSLEVPLLFVDLEHDPPKMITQAENSPVGMQLISIQKFFSTLFPQDGIKDDLLPCHRTESMGDATSSTHELVTSQSSEFIDLSSCMHDTLVTVPTLNGNAAPSKGSQLEELLSFSVPYDLSMGGSKEQWAEAFLAHMQEKWERCRPAWSSLQMEVSECYPQAIVL
ncbi:uncharacterized protein LOC115989716 isoform X3 [Quercus lobata]|uniref:uncharacterized protein LOC115989716 isoform X3 n=1 Tax=Quercus lobata TaxID=97700 RepID=UPI0012474163|nr:uncharacterized protein LOC115989716 isoform X3 [Quercus lobata]